MKSVLQIFHHDVRAVARSFFAVLILIAITILPALYAWLNIYANMDPYGSTGNIRIAVATRDPGFTAEDGEVVNMSREVMAELKESTTIGWVFPDSTDDAIEGVRRGDYYAAIIFEPNFTYNMYHITQAVSDENAPVTYYENAKKNAVASKITQTAASTLQEKINTKYLQTVFETVFKEANGIGDKLSQGDTANAAIQELSELRDTLLSYQAAVEQFTNASPAAQAALQNAQTALSGVTVPSGDRLTDAQKSLALAQQTVSALDEGFSQKLTEVQNQIEQVQAAADALRDSEPYEKLTERVDDLRGKNQTLLATLQALRALLGDTPVLPGAQSAAAALDAMILRAEGIEDLIAALPEDVDGTAIDRLCADASGVCQSLQSLSGDTLAPGLKTMISGLSTTLNTLSPLLTTVSGMLTDLSDVTAAAGSTVTSIDAALTQLSAVLEHAAGKLTEVIDNVERAEGDQRTQLLIELLSGDSVLYGRFFSSLVDVEVQEIYSVKSYGAAMAPFYSVLAVWVGGVILVAILNTHVDEEKFSHASDAQRYFGRFGIFFLMGQLQAGVIVLGDIYLLGCAPMHPMLMWGAAAAASLVFVLLIYSLTLSFGDIGKAIVVVVMVVQIAGSSGSYPIEILPEIFADIYRFFPFPYAINAMREAICGVYQHDYLIYLGELFLFAVLALFIGLVGRRPFMGMNRFVGEKLEETEVI